MSDVTIWLLDRIAADTATAAELKAELPFRRARALTAASRNETDTAKRAKILDEAQSLIDEFLKTSPSGERAIEAYTQKGNLLIERGRGKVEQAKRPGEDVKKLRGEAAAFFDAAIKSLEGKSEPGKPIEKVENAEDAVVQEYRVVKDKIAALKAAGNEKGGKPGRRTASADKEFAALEDEEEALQVKLVQTRLMAASAHFEKAKAFEDGSPEWAKSLEDSAKQFKEIADKYPTKGGGVFARFYEGRNYAMLGKNEFEKSKDPKAKKDPKVDPKKRLEAAVATLAPLTVLDSKAPIAVMLRAKAIGTTLDCWMALGQFDKIDADQRKFALTTVPVERLDADWLTLKYKAAAILDAAAGALPEAEKGKRRPLQEEAKRLATDVAKANKDFAKEARDLLTKLGKSLPNVAAAEETFEAVMDEAKLALSSLTQLQAEAKQKPNTPEAEALLKQAAEAREKAVVGMRKALAVSGDADPTAVNQARYLLTYLLYDGQQYHDAAALGSFLAERYPNAKGSRTAARIAMASWQLLQQKQELSDWKQDAKLQCAGVADLILKTWPEEAESADAAKIAMAVATEARDPQRIMAVLEKVPATAPGRAELMLRAGAALWREVMAQRQLDAGERVPPEQIEKWTAEARSRLTEGFAALPPDAPASPVTVAAALARCQILMDESQSADAVKVLVDPKHGPWTNVIDPKSDPAIREGAFAEAILTVALRCFIQAEDLPKAQQAMDTLEKLAGEGDEKSARLTAMYLSMGRELQAQLESLGAEGKAGGADAAAKAASILGGFEKFLDGLAKRDQKISSQIWVATTYFTLGSGKGTGSVVKQDKAEAYLDRSADVYANLLKRKDDPKVPEPERQELAKFEPSIRLKMAGIFREREKWSDAQEQVDWILADAKRQNSLETQIQAAELLQAAGQQLAAKEPAEAEKRFREATAGRTQGKSVIWGWGGIANKLVRQAFAGSDDKSQKAREQFFAARYNVAACLLARAKLAGKSPQDVEEMLDKAETAVAMTRKLNADMGGDAQRGRFEKLLKDIQKQKGSPSPRGFAELDEKAAAAAAAVPATK